MTWSVSPAVNQSSVARDSASLAAYRAAQDMYTNQTLSAACLSYVPVYECAKNFPACSSDAGEHSVCTFVCNEFKRRCAGELPGVSGLHCPDTGSVCASTAAIQVRGLALLGVLAAASYLGRQGGAS